MVNRLADDHDDGVLDLLLEDLAQGDDAANAARVDAWVRRREQLDLLFSRGD